MTITHHPEPESLMSCAGGSMPEALAAVMASHMEMCPACRNDLAWLELVGTALFEALPPTPVAREAPVMAMRAGDALDGQNHARVAQRSGDVPGPLVQAVGRDLDSIPWTEVSPGVWQYQIGLKTLDRGELRLTKVSPGQSLPKHGSSSSIISLVLKGACRDATVDYQAGDVAEFGDKTEYALIADPNQGCTYLIATTDLL